MGFRTQSRRTLTVAVIIATVAMLSTACASPIVGVLRTDSAGTGAGTDSGSGTSAKPIQNGHCKQPPADSDFQRVDPSSVDLKTEAVTQALAYGTARGAQSVRVYRHDCLVGTSALDPSTENTPLPAWSMTKGVVSIVVGRAVTEGYLKVDDPIGDYIDGLDAEHGAITLRELLTQTSGLKFAWLNDLNAAGTLNSGARVLTRPFKSEPGTEWVYAQTTITAIVELVEAAVGEDFQAYASREVFEPIGIKANEWRWGRDESGRTQGFAFLDMTPKAFARLGSLLLNNGEWDGRQLISRDYIAQGSQGTEAEADYGFLWRTNRPPPGVKPLESAAYAGMRAATPDTYWLSGLFDQNVVMIPELDMVVVRMGLPAEMFGDPYGESPGMRPDWAFRFFKFLLAGVTDMSIPDPGPWLDNPDPEPLVEPDQIIGIGF